MEHTFTIDELYILRQALDAITILGKNARQLADLQTKLEHLLTDPQNTSLPADLKVKTK
jgi:hypothetical protein